jgi:hypothetical protein
MGYPTIFAGRVDETPGPDIHINCPFCYQDAVLARTYELYQEFGLILTPRSLRIKKRYNLVRCSLCGRELFSKIPLGELCKYKPFEMDGFLVKRALFVVNFLALACILLCWAPFVGVVLSLISFIASLKHKGWPLLVSIVGIFLSGGITIVVIKVLMEAHARK